MTTKIAFRVNEAIEAGAALRAAADAYGQSARESFTAWVETTTEAMREEVPKESWETHDSIEAQHHGPMEATIGPTNRDDAGRPVAFFINYGRGGQPPDDFIGRTTARSQAAIDDFDISGVL